MSGNLSDLEVGPPERVIITVSSLADIKLSETPPAVYRLTKSRSEIEVMVPWYVPAATRAAIHGRFAGNRLVFVVDGPVPKNRYLPPVASVIVFLVLAAILLPLVTESFTFLGAMIICLLFAYYLRKDTVNRMVNLQWLLGFFHEAGLKSKELNDAVLKYKRGETNGPAWGHPLSH